MAITYVGTKDGKQGCLTALVRGAKFFVLPRDSPQASPVDVQLGTSTPPYHTITCVTSTSFATASHTIDCWTPIDRLPTLAMAYNRPYNPDELPR